MTRILIHNDQVNHLYLPRPKQGIFLQQLRNYGARYYHADLPRFISPDPIGGKVEIHTSWNRYLYCRGKAIFQGKCWENIVLCAVYWQDSTYG
ncbi:hypothetical protein K8T06_13980 [bacterium]|nr:hypothetical protein [bacterium]